MLNLEIFLAEVKDKPDGKAAQQFDYLCGYRCIEKSKESKVFNLPDFRKSIGQVERLTKIGSLGGVPRYAYKKWCPRLKVSDLKELVRSLGAITFKASNAKVGADFEISGVYFTALFYEPVGQARVYFPLDPYGQGVLFDAFQCFRYLHATSKITDEDLICD